MSQRCRQQKAAIKWAGYFWVLWKTMVFQGSSCQRRSSTITMASLGKLKDRVGGERINFADVFCARAAKNSNSNFHSSLHLFNFTIIRIKRLCAWLELAALQNVFSQIKWKLNDARTAFLSKPSLTQRANLIWILSSTHRPLIFFIIMRMLQTLDGCPSIGTLTHTHTGKHFLQCGATLGRQISAGCVVAPDSARKKIQIKNNKKYGKNSPLIIYTIFMYNIELEMYQKYLHHSQFKMM